MKKDEIYQLLNNAGVNATMVANSLNVRPQSVAKVIATGGARRGTAKVESTTS